MIASILNQDHFGDTLDANTESIPVSGEIVEIHADVYLP